MRVFLLQFVRACGLATTYHYPRGLAVPGLTGHCRLWGLNCTLRQLLPQNQLEKVGGDAPPCFQWVLRREEALQGGGSNTADCIVGPSATQGVAGSEQLCLGRHCCFENMPASLILALHQTALTCCVVVVGRQALR